MTREPAREELRMVAIVADAWQRIDAARMYGLLEGGPEVDAERCEEIIARARVAGFEWSADEAIAAAIELTKLIGVTAHA